MFLADILRTYHEEHGSNVRSSSHSKVALNYWLDHWQTSTVQDVADIKQQEAFHAFLRKKGLKESSVLRVLTTGKAALNRAFKRGELKQVPYILTVKANKGEPKGRALEVAELKLLYAASPLHLRVFILWMLGTAARPEAILDLTDKQVFEADGLIDLNPAGREQTKKYRPIVRLIPALARMGFEGPLIVTKSAAVDSVKTAWRAARTEAKLDGRVQPYSLRHTAARWMRRHGVSEWDTSTQLGHRRPGTTETYTAFDPAYLNGAADALNKLVEAVAGELPVWATGTAMRAGKPVQRVGWYEAIPDGFRGVRANCAPVTEIASIAAE
ncbi:hypothetical protein EN808_13030 [Mesorhizobium sp. M8A.F.Ca.ET.165.01.1.1]|nr:hypothetical protein EN808_13030 [Mesorhizobium sp. M8A.F.Ca.ET.165.01.1.1]